MKKLLRVMSIIMIILGGIGIATYLISLQGVSLTAGVLGLDEGILTTSYIFWLLASIAETLAGILGIAFSKNAGKMIVCIILGIATAGLSVIGYITGGVALGGVSWWGIISSIVIPVIYLIAAFRVRAID